MKRRKLYVSKDDSILTGVCGGISEYLNIDPTFVRLAVFIIAIPYSIVILLYILLAIIMPRKHDDDVSIENAEANSDELKVNNVEDEFEPKNEVDKFVESKANNYDIDTELKIKELEEKISSQKKIIDNHENRNFEQMVNDSNLQQELIEKNMDLKVELNELKKKMKDQHTKLKKESKVEIDKLTKENFDLKLRIEELEKDNETKDQEK